MIKSIYSITNIGLSCILIAILGMLTLMYSPALGAKNINLHRVLIKRKCNEKKYFVLFWGRFYHAFRVDLQRY